MLLYTIFFLTNVLLLKLDKDDESICSFKYNGPSVSLLKKREQKQLSAAFGNA